MWGGEDYGIAATNGRGVGRSVGGRRVAREDEYGFGIGLEVGVSARDSEQCEWRRQAA